jgi:phosphoglycerol transferase MdoB-like AlkP superfamily enzyme
MIPSIINSIQIQLQRLLTLAKQLILLLCFYLFFRVLFFLFNMEYYPEMDWSRFLLIVKGGLLFDWSAIMFLNSLYIFLFLLPFQFVNKRAYKKVLAILFVVSNSFAFAFNMGDIFYFDYTLKRSTADVFMFAGENNMDSLFLSFLKNYWYGFLLFFCIVYLLWYGYKRIRIRIFMIKNHLVFLFTGLIMLTIVGALALVGMRGSFVIKTFPITIGDAGEYTKKPQDMALVLNTPFTIIKTIETQALERKSYFTKNELDSIFSPIHIPSTDNKFKSQNVVIIVMEGYSRELIGAMNPKLDSTESYTPFLDSLIKVSYSFPRAFANGRQSISALPAITSSIPYVKQAFVTSTYATNQLCSLGKILNKKGYHTSFFHGAENGSIGLGAFMKLAGYQYYYGKNEYGNDKDYDGSWGIFDDAFFQFFNKELSGFKEPFHSVIFSLSSHNPYVIPEEFEERYRHVESDRKKTYLYSDYALQHFFHEASKSSWFDSTLFVITADHSVRSKKKVYNTSVNSYAIPILFYSPSDTSLVGVDRTVVQHLDLMPSILSYLNYNEPFFSFGSNCFDSLNSRGAFINHLNIWQHIQGDYVFTYSTEKSKRLYNYMLDPHLKKDLSTVNKEIAIEMETQLKAFIQQHNNRMIDNKLLIE